MPKSSRDRSRLMQVDLAGYFTRPGPPTNVSVHSYLHRDKKLHYTSKATLDTNAGGPLYPPYSGALKWVSASVDGAPTTGNLTYDVLLNGNSVFETAAKPTIPQGQKWGYTAVPLAPHFSRDNRDYIQVQVTAINGATGPIRVTLGFREMRGPML
jgi:hypothetical protein